MKFFSWAIIFLVSCSSMERSEKDKMKKTNMTYQPIVRQHDEKILSKGEMILVEKEKYPWEKQLLGRYSPITKEHFRCKGNPLNPQIQVASESETIKVIRDCGGIDKHSLPVKGDKEFIYPLLIELLNEIQKKMAAKVVVTCGHRCVEHNLYSDQTQSGRVSKHMIGAEVDFYVEGYENKPQEVLQVIRQFYQDTTRYQGLKEFQVFSKVSTNKIENKEIAVTINSKNEKRDYDNRHPYPYLTIDLKFDFDAKKRVEYTWKEAHHNLMQN
jgi:hypothetical protein